MLWDFFLCFPIKNERGKDLLWTRNNRDELSHMTSHMAQENWKSSDVPTNEPSLYHDMATGNKRPTAWQKLNCLLSVFRAVFIWVSKSNIGFAFTTLRNWLKKLAPIFHPIRSKTKTNRDSVVRVFPRFVSVTCNYFVFWLVLFIICVLCDWLEWLLWFWFYDTQLKTALLTL